jgi:hypothetical protein
MSLRVFRLLLKPASRRKPVQIPKRALLLDKPLRQGNRSQMTSKFVARKHKPTTRAEAWRKLEPWIAEYVDPNAVGHRRLFLLIYKPAVAPLLRVRK